MIGRPSTVWRILRLVLMALVVLAPPVLAEPRSDRVSLVHGKGGGGTRQAVLGAALTSPRAASHLEHDEAYRSLPRAASVTRFLLHRALLN